MNVQNILRDNMRKLHPYSCARDEFKGEASVYLDANESPYNTPLNRYPDPLQLEVKASISKIKAVPVSNIFLGNGSDEAIDLLFRAFCEPRIDNVVAIEPTYGMYKVCADINDVEYRKVLLDNNFQFSAEDIFAAIDEKTKLIWFCSPNNPTGNSLKTKEIEKVLQNVNAVVIVDEAYIDFSAQRSFVNRLKQYDNLVVLQTFSKAWAHAAIRFGMAFASEEIISVLNKIKYPYNINILTQQQALIAMKGIEETKEQVQTLLAEKERLADELGKLTIVKRIYPSDANFLLVRVTNANQIYTYLTQQGIIVRNRNTVTLCNDCLRITVGVKSENSILIERLKQYKD